MIGANIWIAGAFGIVVEILKFCSYPREQQIRRIISCVSNDRSAQIPFKLHFKRVQV